MVNLNSNLSHLWANIYSTAASPHFRALRANNVADEIHNFENEPNYQELFGSLDYCECEHCRSIFSPAAYFVDLMRIANESITTKNTIEDKFKLENRRPDLAQIKLTCQNTNKLVPYLDIVNRVLALKLHGLNDNPLPITPAEEKAAIDRTYQKLAKASQPFNLPLEQIRSYLAHLKTDLASIYKLFNQPKEVIARESLGLSKEEYDLIKTSEFSFQPSQLIGYWALNEGNGISINDADNQHNGIVEGNDNPWETVTNFPGTSSRSVLKFDGKTSAKIASTTLSKGDTPHTISTWVYIDELPETEQRAWILVLGQQEPNSHHWVIDNQYATNLNGKSEFGTWGDQSKQLRNLPLERIIGKWAHLATTYDGENYTAYINGEKQASTKASFNFTNTQLLFTPPSDDRPFKGKLANLSIWQEALSPTAIRSLFNNPNQIALFNSPNQTDRIDSLAKKLNWSLRDLYWVISSFPEIASDKNVEIINNISTVKQLQNQLNLPLDVICSFWHDLKTISLSNEEDSLSLFDTIFNNPQVLKDLTERYPSEASWKIPKDISKENQNGSKEEDNLKIAHRIAAGLQVSLTDLTTLAKALFSSEKTTKDDTAIALTLENLSVLYRHAKLSKVFQLPIPQYLIFLELIGKQDKKVFDISDIQELLDNAQWLKDSGFNVYELDFILKGNDDKYIDKDLQDKQIEEFLKSLRALSENSLQIELSSDNIVNWVELVSSFKPKSNNSDTNTPGNLIWHKLSSENPSQLSQHIQDFKELIREIFGDRDISDTPENYQIINDAINNNEKLFKEKAEIIRQLNEILKQKDFYDQSYFEEVAISQEIKDFLAAKENLSSDQILILNRSLLEASYPQELVDRDLVKELKEKLFEHLAAYLKAPINILKPIIELVIRDTTRLIESFFIKPKDTEENPNVFIVKKILTNISKWLIVVQKIQLNQFEIDSIRNHPDAYGKETAFQLSDLDKIKTLCTLKQLNKAFENTENGLIQYFDNPSIEKLAKITGWNQSQIGQLAGELFQDSKKLPKTIEEIVKFKQVFDLTHAIGVNISFYKPLIEIASKSAEDDWQSYLDTAQSVIHTVKAKYSDDDWLKVSQQIGGDLNEKTREVLTEYALWKLNQTEPNLSIKNRRDLSEYLLLDVETTKCSEVSYIKQAILSLQMYLQRCRMNLEPGVTQIDIPESEWDWIMSYRVWEANRKVFLYPENYIEPNLRKNKTDLFQELESELLQSNITQEAVEAAYHNYFTKLEELGKLQIVEAYHCFVEQSNGKDSIDTLFIFGKTATEPVTYYYRKCINPTAKKPTWKPWSKIDVTMHSEHIAPVFAFNKLFIFWVETKETTETSKIENGLTTKTTTKKATIKYIYQESNQNWVQPQTLYKDIAIPSTTEAFPTLGLVYLDKSEMESKIFIRFRSSHEDLLSVILKSNLFIEEKNYKADDGTKWILFHTIDFDKKTAIGDTSLSPFSKFNCRAVKNQILWMIINHQKESFLWISTKKSLHDEKVHYPEPISDRLDIQENTNEIVLKYISSKDLIVETIIPVDHVEVKKITISSLAQLGQKILIGGIDNLLTLESQLTFEIGLENFPPPQLPLNGSYGIYLQEIFFHIPFLIANTLNTNQHFSEAQKWYHYIFNPTQRNQPKPKPINFWSLDEGEQSTDIKDLIGDCNGVINLPEGQQSKWANEPIVPGNPAREVLIFDGNNTISIDKTNLSLGNTPHSISAWIYLDRPYLKTYRSWILVLGQQANNSHHWLIENLYGHSKSQFGPWGEKGQQFLNLPFKEIARSWTHIATSYDGAHYSVYINGKKYGSKPAEFNFTDTSLTIAKAHPSNSNPDAEENFQGKIANIKIWDFPLSHEQVIDDFNQHQNDRFWRYLPFRDNTFDNLQSILTDDQAIRAYDEDPFDPHAIADLRIGTYQKAIVMKYIDNLLDWGDSLFAQDTWESITQATMLYFFAYDLLGPKPEELGKGKSLEPATFSQIQEKYKDKIPQFLIDFVGQLGNNLEKSPTPFNDLNSYFCVSENEQFTKYWDRVQDRLYKIRHCENIEGIFQRLALFEPAIDPNQIVRAVAGGNTPISVASGLKADIPNYRFSYMIERARNLTSTLIQLGASLLSALEKKDAEQLSLLRATQQPAILRLIQTTKEKQITEAQASLESLNKSLESATDRVNHYQGLINNGLSEHEKDSEKSTKKSLDAYKAARLLNDLAVPAYLIPTIFGFSDGGFQPGATIQAAAAAADGYATIDGQRASQAATFAQYSRRTEDWKLQLQIAQDEVSQINQQIAASQINVDIATTELTNHKKSIEQANDVENFLKDKFSTSDLYQWMVSRLAVLYFQTFKLALDMALAAQKAYQYELNLDDTYIQFDYWDSLEKGLLAGEGLMLGLNQLEAAYLEGNVRRLEIEKTIPLSTLESALDLESVLEDLKNDMKNNENNHSTAKCTFRLGEDLFDKDFPSHYCRQIKTISISIPAVVGPYQNINATLTQTSNTTYTKPDKKAPRTNLRSNQKIALSKGINDAGVFELNFRDERYLPFEGTGAISNWELSLSSETCKLLKENKSLTDVIIHLRYTALDAGDTFKKD